jgi:hypothetical protein
MRKLEEKEEKESLGGRIREEGWKKQKDRLTR